MRATVIHVTDHARERWHKRVSITGNENVYDIIEAVKESTILKKSIPLPYGLPRLPQTVYSIRSNIVFVMESVTIDEYRLVTVISEQDKTKIKRATGPPSRGLKRNLAFKKKLSRQIAAKQKPKEDNDGSGVNHKKRFAYKKRREQKIPPSEEVDGFDTPA